MATRRSRHGERHPDDAAMMRDVGARIRAKRLALGLTQKEIAQRAGMAQAAVSDVEHGTRPTIGLVYIYRLASVLAIPMHRLLPNPRENDVDWLQRRLRDDSRFPTRGDLYAVDLANTDPDDLDNGRRRRN